MIAQPHVIEWQHLPNGNIRVVCRAPGHHVLNVVPNEELARFITGRHRARFFPEYRRRQPVWG